MFNKHSQNKYSEYNKIKLKLQEIGKNVIHTKSDTFT